MESWLHDRLSKGKVKVSSEASDDDEDEEDPEKPSLEAFVRWTRGGHVTVEREYSSQSGHLSFMLVLEPVWKEAVRAGSLIREMYIDLPQVPSYRSKDEKSVTEYLASLSKLVDANTKRKAGNALSTSEGLELMRAHRDARERLWRFQRSNQTLSIGLEDFLLDEKEAEPETLKKAGAAIIDYLTFMRYMEGTRRHFSPQSGGGHQQDLLDAHRSLAEVVIETCARRRKER